MEKFELQTFCNLIREHSISHVYAAPPIVLHLAKNRSINGSDLASLRMITSGGAPLGEALIQETHSRWKVPLRQAYGLSETTSVSHIQVNPSIILLKHANFPSAGTAGTKASDQTVQQYQVYRPKS